MDEAAILEVAQEAIWVLLQVAGPIMLVALTVGLVIALFQALTQIQEITLTFVPKIIVIFVSLLVFLPHMGEVLGGFMAFLAERIVGTV